MSYFLLGCIPARILLVVLALKIPLEYLEYLGYLTGIISLSIMYIYLTGMRMNVPEAGGVTWWNDIRILHSLLYLTATIYAFKRKRYMWIPLALDVLLALTVFYLHYYQGAMF